jgi:hypothetical protein
MFRIALHCGHNSKLQVSSVFIGLSLGTSKPPWPVGPMMQAAYPQLRAYNQDSPFPLKTYFASVIRGLNLGKTCQRP